MIFIALLFAHCIGPVDKEQIDGISRRECVTYCRIDPHTDKRECGKWVWKLAR